MTKKNSFAARLLAWFDQHGRRDLPWQHPRTAYRVWLAEVMLQQTQVTTVIPYYQRFLARFPSLHTLAEAPQEDVLALWAGLGYYARARNLHRCAQVLVAEHNGEFPRALDAVQALPGIGRSTAAAILSQVHGDRHAILDGNVRRVLARHGAIAGWTGAPTTQKKLWALAESLLPDARLADYTQAIMDLGATLCTARRPACERCPVAADCIARVQERTVEFPAAKPKRARPQRHTRMLVQRNARGDVWLVQRPQKGVWGGLWCLPELPGEAATPSGAEILPVLHHGFTHFDLDITPLLLRRQHVEGEGRWITLRSPLTIGVPAPVQTILRNLP